VGADIVGNPYSITTDDVAAALTADVANGLTEAEADTRRAKYGDNTLGAAHIKSPWWILLGQFRSPFIWLLAIAAGLSGYFKDIPEAVAILAVLVLNTLTGFYMEYKAERSMAALSNMIKSKCKVVRGGSVTEVLADVIVPGDVLYVEAGDLIAADARIISLAQLYVDETALTGESLPVEKKEEVLDAGTVLADRLNMLYKGTIVTRGNSRALVTGTGKNTEYGKIATLVEASARQATPLEKKIRVFSNKILLLVLVLIVLIVTAGLLEGKNFLQLLETAIALAVAAIPEGLPIVTTLALARAMLKMSAKNVIVKSLPSIETLGATTVICTDKTGTLTQNKIEANAIITPEGRLDFKIDAMAATIAFQNAEAGSSAAQNIKMAATIAALCNTAEIKISGTKIEELGDPLETALLKFARGAGVPLEELKVQYKKLAEVPFSSETKLMATAQSNNNQVFTAVKGAADEVLKLCNRQLDKGAVTELNATRISELNAQAGTLAAEGLRVIALAYNETDSLPETLLEQLVFCCLIGMMDPPAEGVQDAIAQCRDAGVKVIMITGDHPETARNIGLSIGLLDSEKADIIHGRDMPAFESLDDEQRKRWLSAAIFARVSPQQKLDLVTLLQSKNEVVGMTGDGVNDAPALKQADIGIAMGIRGTQAAQEAADMVLKDDAFSSILTAIYEGRIIFNNIRMFVVYLLSCNISELILVSVTSFFDLGFFLAPLQILYINLATDVLPALALGVTGGDKDLMRQPPRNPSEQLVGNAQWWSIFVYALVISVFSVVAAYAVRWVVPAASMPDGMGSNVLFATLIFCQLLNVFNMAQRSSATGQSGAALLRNKMIWLALLICTGVTILVYCVPFLATALALQIPPASAVAIIAGCSVASLVVIQLLKKLKLA
jgi:Ca2+-transporting ATPase